MGFAARSLVHPIKSFRFFHLFLLVTKLAKAVSYFAAYDLLQKFHSLTLLLVMKLIAVVVLIPLQKPFSGSKLNCIDWLRIAKYAALRVFVDFLWIEGLLLCGPLRFLLLFEHSELLVLGAASTFIFSSSSTRKVRGTVFFTIGILCVIFFDHDYSHIDADHPEGVHKSLLIHHMYELFINFGLSDHKAGVVLLIIAVCLDAGSVALSRHLVASIGGAKRFYSLSNLVSLVGILPLCVINHVYISNSSTLPVEKANMESASYGSNDAPVKLHTVFWFMYTSLLQVSDFYLTSLISLRLDVNEVAKLSKQFIILTGLVISLFWSSSVSFVDSSLVENHLKNLLTLTHHISTGVLIAIMCILYASNLLICNSTIDSDGNHSGHFIGYSMAGLPLFTSGRKHQDFISLSNSEQMGLWFHVRATMNGIMNGQASRKIFVFLCLNLVFTFVELLYGVWTNSLGLISDGFHMLFDSAALVVGLYAAVVAHWKPTRIFSFGYMNAEILSGFVNALFLLVISASVFVNAVTRIHRPPDINTDRLMAVSIAGLLVNLVGVVALGHAHSHGPGQACSSHGHGHSHSGHGHSHNVPTQLNLCNNTTHENFTNMQCGHMHNEHKTSLNHVSDDKSHTNDANLRGVYLHVLADTLGSVGVIFSSFLVSNYGLKIADPICSLFISGVIGYSAAPLLTDTMSLLTLKAPCNINLDLLIKKILQLNEVTHVRNVFAWSQLHNVYCLSMAVQIENQAQEQLMLTKIKDVVRSHSSTVSHLTVQIEKEDFHNHMEAMGMQVNSLSVFSKAQIIQPPCDYRHHHSDECNSINHLSSHSESTLVSIKDV